MRTNDLDIVRNLPLFADMDRDNFADLMQLAYYQGFPAQVQLISEGDQADFLYVVCGGCVELFANANGRETTMALVRPVSTFILAAVLKDAPYLMSARTTHASRILMIPSPSIQTMFAKDACFARSIVLELASCYRGVVKALKNQKLRTGAERLANYILRKHQECGANGSMALDVDKRTLAALLGMTPENLSRAFATLKPYGVIVDGRNILISDIQQLDQLAKATPMIDNHSS